MKFSSYVIGTYIGSHLMSLITAYIGTQIKSVEDIFKGGSVEISIIPVLLAVLAGILIICLICAVMKDAQHSLSDIIDKERDE